MPRNGHVPSSGVAVDGAGNVYIADSDNSRVVEVAAGVASVLNTGSLTLSVPSGIAVDGTGDVYIADSSSNRVVEVTAAGVASVLNVGTPDGLGLSSITGLTVDGAGDVLIADTGNNRVVEVTAAGVANILNNSSLTLPATAFTQSAAGAPLKVTLPSAIYSADPSHSRLLAGPKQQPRPPIWRTSPTWAAPRRQKLQQRRLHLLKA